MEFIFFVKNLVKIWYFYEYFQNNIKIVYCFFCERNTRIEELESKLAIKQNIIDTLEIKCDGNE